MSEHIVSRTISFQELTAHHDVSSFRCGKDALDNFIGKFATGHPRQGLSRTWVAIHDDRIVAFYTLALATVTTRSATARVAKGAPRLDLPAILLARLAVDRPFQGQGLGAIVLEQALRRCLTMADAAQAANAVALPVRAILVHAKDEEAAGFYEHAGFERSPTDPLHLMVLVKDLKRLLTRSTPAPPGR
jgi:GNAT superfamily N-acetyltransferase